MSREQPEAPRTHYNVCWNEGYDDHVADYDLSECPYERGSDSHAFWSEGWRDAETDVAREPGPTDAELDERPARKLPIVLLPHGKLQCMVCENIWPNEHAQVLEAQVAALEKQSKAKDAVLAEIREHCKKNVYQAIKTIRAALDKGTGGD